MKRPGQNGTAQIEAVKAIDISFARFHVFSIFQQKTIQTGDEMRNQDNQDNPKMYQDLYDSLWCFFWNIFIPFRDGS